MNAALILLLSIQALFLILWAFMLAWQLRLRDEMRENHERWAREDAERMAEFKRLVLAEPPAASAGRGE